MSISVTKRIIFLGLVVVALAFAIIYSGIIFQKESGAQHMIELQPDGFYPKELTIQKGDTVVFTTTREKPFWPASNLHPTHGMYPEFDPKEPVEPRASWSFRFTKIGEWKYHDHLSPGFIGTIIVGEKKTESGMASAEECASGENKLKCWENVLNAVLRDRGLDQAFTLLAELYRTETAFAAECHSFAHTLGIAAYHKFSKREDVELSPKTYYCGYGFYHGFMETLLHATGDVKEAQKFCAYAEEKLASETSDAGGACYHGIGHGAVDGGDPRAWGDADAMIKPGMDLCRRVSRNDADRYRCVTGVFNAIEILARDSKYRLAKLGEDPFSICPKQDERDKEGCYTNMMPRLLTNLNNDFSAIAKQIEAIPEKSGGYAIRDMVILSLFHEYIRMHFSESDYAKKGIALCRSLNPRSRLPCIEGLSGGHMKYGEPQNEYKKGLAFCGSNLLRDDEKEICYRHILTRLRVWYREEKAREICGLAERKYQSFCGL
ncbi:MAG: hypothetical protein HYT37_02705 [Candidatus Sungbacteria bacterium]|nr:hypothetical protein [Candidatus Sungbacteria bacterium]